VAEEGRDGEELPLAAEDDGRNRRRGRRGGRRRRRDGDGEVSPFSVPGAEQPELPPMYAGPTPADPFGGRAFDIFDMMDQVEQAAEAKSGTRTPAGEIANTGAPEAEAGFGGPAGEEAAAPTEAAEAPAPAEVPEAEPEIVNATAPEPAAASLLATTEAQSDDAAKQTANGLDEIVAPEPPPPEPAIRPILVGADGEAPPERKRGWWRR